MKNKKSKISVDAKDRFLDFLNFCTNKNIITDVGIEKINDVVWKICKQVDQQTRLINDLEKKISLYSDMIENMKMISKIKMTADEAFEMGMGEFIKKLWIKMINPLFPKDGAKYPGRVSKFINVKVDGKEKTFRIDIKEVKHVRFKKRP